MSWYSRSTAFPCDPSLGSAMRKAAKVAQDEVFRVEDLWIRMLRCLGAECGLVDDQQRTNLTQLMQQRPQALPPWLLASRKLHAHLTVKAYQVFLKSRGTMDIAFPYFIERANRARATNQQQQLGRLCGAGEELLASAATSCAANTGFLLLQPPLPTQLLAQADTASMLSLAQVCRGLRCASFELLRREHACLHGIHSAKGPAPPPYLPLQHLPAEQQQQQPCRILQDPQLGHCRANRALSLLCGSPEAAAQQLLQHRAGGSSTTGDSPAAAADHVSSSGGEIKGEDVFTRVFQLVPRGLVTDLMILNVDYLGEEPMYSALYWVKPEHLPEVLQLMEDNREEVLAMEDQQPADTEDTEEVRRKELEGLMEVARSAARLGCALCLLYVQW